MDGISALMEIQTPLDLTLTGHSHGRLHRGELCWSSAGVRMQRWRSDHRLDWNCRGMVLFSMLWAAGVVHLSCARVGCTLNGPLEIQVSVRWEDREAVAALDHYPFLRSTRGLTCCFREYGSPDRRPHCRAVLARGLLRRPRGHLPSQWPQPPLPLGDSLPGRKLKGKPPAAIDTVCAWAIGLRLGPVRVVKDMKSAGVHSSEARAVINVLKAAS
eukprot:gene7701-5403_t